MDPLLPPVGHEDLQCVASHDRSNRRRKLQWLSNIYTVLIHLQMHRRYVHNSRGKRWLQWRSWTSLFRQPCLISSIVLRILRGWLSIRAVKQQTNAHNWSFSIAQNCSCTFLETALSSLAFTRVNTANNERPRRISALNQRGKQPAFFEWCSTASIVSPRLDTDIMHPMVSSALLDLDRPDRRHRIQATVD